MNTSNKRLLTTLGVVFILAVVVAVGFLIIVNSSPERKVIMEYGAAWGGKPEAALDSVYGEDDQDRTANCVRLLVARRGEKITPEMVGCKSTDNPYKVVSRMAAYAFSKYFPDSLKQDRYDTVTVNEGYVSFTMVTPVSGVEGWNDSILDSIYSGCNNGYRYAEEIGNCREFSIGGGGMVNPIIISPTPVRYGSMGYITALGDTSKLQTGDVLPAKYMNYAGPVMIIFANRPVPPIPVGAFASVYAFPNMGFDQPYDKANCWPVLPRSVVLRERSTNPDTYFGKVRS